MEGSAFLLWFWVLTLMAFVVWWWRNIHRPISDRGRQYLGEALEDPYLCAALRGGRSEIVRLAIFRGVERGWIARQNGTDNLCVTAAYSEYEAKPNELERAMIAAVRTQVRTGKVFTALLKNSMVGSHMEHLRRLGLLYDSKNSTISLAAVMVVSLELVLLARLIQDYMNGYQDFMGVMFSVLVVAVLYTMFGQELRPVTRQGLMALNDRRTKLTGVKSNQGLWGVSEESLWAAALYGLHVLVAAESRELHSLISQGASGSSGTDWSFGNSSSNDDSSFGSNSSSNSSLDVGNGGDQW